MVALPSLGKLRLHSTPTATILDEFGQVQEGGSDAYAELLMHVVPDTEDSVTLRDHVNQYHQALQHVAAVSKTATDTNVFKTIAAKLEIPTALETGSDRNQDFPEAWNGALDAVPENAVMDPQEAAMIQRKSLFSWMAWATNANLAKLLPEIQGALSKKVGEQEMPDIPKALWLASVVPVNEMTKVLEIVLEVGKAARFDEFVQRMEAATVCKFNLSDASPQQLVDLLEAGAKGGLSPFQVALHAVETAKHGQNVLYPTDHEIRQIRRWRDLACAAARKGHADVVLFCHDRLRERGHNYDTLKMFWSEPIRLLAHFNHNDGVIAVIKGAVLGVGSERAFKVKCEMISAAVKFSNSDTAIRQLMESAYTHALVDAPVDKCYMPQDVVEATIEQIQYHARALPLEELVARGRAFIAGLALQPSSLEATLPNGNGLLEVAIRSEYGAARWYRGLVYTLAVLDNRVPMKLELLAEAMRFVLGKALYKPFETGPSNDEIIACFVQLRSLYESNRTESNPGRAAHHLVTDLFSSFFHELARLISNRNILRICPPDLLAGLINAHLDDATPSPHAPPVDVPHAAKSFREMFARILDAVAKLKRSHLGHVLDGASQEVLDMYKHTIEGLVARLAAPEVLSARG